VSNFHKQTIWALAVAVFLAIGAFFMANVPMPPWSKYISPVNIVLFALPSLWAVRRWLGWRDGAIFFGVLGLYALAIETSAIITGFPYGHFAYAEHLGYRIFGYAPWTVAFAWTPLALGAYAIARNISGSRIARLILVPVLLTLFDVVLDPGAVYLGFWKYPEGGWFYGVPWSNFAGWLLSGFIGAVLIEVMVARFRPLLPTPVQLSISSIFTVFFWAVFAFFASMEEPALLGTLLVFGMVVIYRRFHYRFDDMVVLVDEDNNPIRTEQKLIAHNGYTQLHRAFSVFLFNSKGELLLQQRAFGKKTWPGVWSNSCCGHVMLHETVAAAAKRRVKYELGLSGIDLKLALPDFRYIAEMNGIVENEICPVFIGFTDKEPQPNPEEVAAVRWQPWEEFLADARRPDTELSPWCILEAEQLAELPELEGKLHR